MIRKWSLLAALLVGASSLIGCVVDVDSESDDFALEDDVEAFEQEAPTEQVIGAAPQMDEQQAANRDVMQLHDNAEEPRFERVVVNFGNDGEQHENLSTYAVVPAGGGGGDDEGPDPQPWKLNAGPDPQPWKLPFEKSTDSELGPDPQPW